VDPAVQVKGRADGGTDGNGDDEDESIASLEHPVDADVNDTKPEGKENGVGHPLGESLFEKTTDEAAKENGGGIDENT